MRKIPVYTISKRNVRNQKTFFVGTLEELIGNSFAYTLEAGNSFNPTIPVHPTCIFGLVKALNRSAAETRRYNDYYELETVTYK